MNYSFLSYGHIVAALLSLVTGALVLSWPKGTNRHKLAGYWYVGSMVVLNLSALSIYRLTGAFGPFHVMALISFTGLLAGFIPVFLKRPENKWLQRHLNFMAWSYIGLLMASTSEVAVRLPSAPFWPGVIVGSLIIYAGGWLLLSRHRNRLLAEHERTRAQQGALGNGPRAARRPWATD